MPLHSFHCTNLVPRVSLLPFLGAGERVSSFSRSKEGKKRDPGNEVRDPGNEVVDPGNEVVIVYSSFLSFSCYLRQIWWGKSGTHSPCLLALTLALWQWCQERNIMISAQHVHGKLNTIADSKSRVFNDFSEWKLDPQTIFPFLKGCKIDLFASRLSTQLPRYASWRPDPEALGPVSRKSRNFSGVFRVT